MSKYDEPFPLVPVFTGNRDALLMHIPFAGRDRFSYVLHHTRAMKVLYTCENNGDMFVKGKGDTLLQKIGVVRLPMVLFKSASGVTSECIVDFLWRGAYGTYRDRVFYHFSTGDDGEVRGSMKIYERIEEGAADDRDPWRADKVSGGVVSGL